MRRLKDDTLIDDVSEMAQRLVGFSDETAGYEIVRLEQTQEGYNLEVEGFCKSNTSFRDTREALVDIVTRLKRAYNGVYFVTVSAQFDTEKEVWRLVVVTKEV